MSKRKSGKVCAAKKCENKSYNCNLSFFTFPKDRARAQRWLVACGREDLLRKVDKLDSYRLCAAHFEHKMYMNDIKTRLLPSAVPILFPSLECSSTRDEHVDHNYCITFGKRGSFTAEEGSSNLEFFAGKLEENLWADECETPSENTNDINCPQ